MACDTCVEITQTAEVMGQDNLRLKRTNRVMRTVNGMLRRHLQHVQAASDELFAEFCDTDKYAELAMGELWGSGEFDCGPQDYGFIVERCLEAVIERSERRNTPAHAV